jgi:hypothetical protein
MMQSKTGISKTCPAAAGVETRRNKRPRLAGSTPMKPRIRRCLFIAYVEIISRPSVRQAASDFYHAFRVVTASWPSHITGPGIASALAPDRHPSLPHFTEVPSVIDIATYVASRFAFAEFRFSFQRIRHFTDAHFTSILSE